MFFFDNVNLSSDFLYTIFQFKYIHHNKRYKLIAHALIYLLNFEIEKYIRACYGKI